MSTSRFAPPSKTPPSTPLSGKKSPIQELLTSRDTASFPDAVISAMFGISLALGSISKSQEVLLDKIDCIAQKLETLQNQVHYLVAQRENLEMNLPENSNLPSEQELEAWLASPSPTRAVGISLDITCSETLWPSRNL